MCSVTTASVVLYNSRLDDVYRLLKCCQDSGAIKKLFVVDNSPKPILPISNLDGVEYYHLPRNEGYGYAHNFALKKALLISKYHIVLNPDIEFDKDVIIKLVEFAQSNEKIGLIMPRIISKDGSTQNLCKLLPTPFDLIFRRFFSSIDLALITKRNELFELRFTKYDKIMDVPFLSGCFMFLRTEILNQVGLFDERFFMYGEDIDLSRRIHAHYKTIYYPHVKVVHLHEKASYKNNRMLLIHIVSIIKYFNKWGWFFDKERKIVNRDTLRKLENDGASL